MGRLNRSGNPTPDRLVRFDAMLESLDYSGPNLHVHVLEAQRPGEIIVLVWRDETDEVQTEQATFSAKGTVDQTFGAPKQWLTREGWLQA